jgi:uncharacterized sporulation protein YeaH/YhbH (DUF444 family)
MGVSPLECGSDGPRVAVHQGECDDQSGNSQRNTGKGGQCGSAQQNAGPAPEKAQGEFEFEFHVQESTVVSMSQ